MKIRRLDLLAFGPFTGVSLDLSAGDRGLHLIHGPNEAGKSSALRAIHDLFYGIGGQTPDDFLHDYGKLRIGAAIEGRGGGVLEFRRRKGNKNTLLAADETPLEPEALDAFLGGVDSETFRSLFGIDHRRLVEGGKEILEGRGRVGQLLFAAGSGLTGLRAATDSIREEAEQLFKPRGQNPEINRLLGQVDDLRKQVLERQLPGEEWARHDEALRDATRRRDELSGALLERGRERGRLQRIRDALIPIAERDELLARLDAVRDVVPLAADFADRHRAAREGRSRALALAEQAEADLRTAEERLEAIETPDDLLARGEEVEALHRRLGEYLKGQQDRPGLLRMQQGDEHFARDLLVELGRPRDLAAAADLRLRGDIPEQIRDLGRRKAALDANLDRHRHDREVHTDDLRERETALEAIGPEPDVEPLRRAVDRCRKLGDPEADLVAGRADLEDEHRALLRDLERLPDWSGPLDALARLTAPLDETIAEADRALAEQGRRVEQADRDLAAAVDEWEAIDVEVRALTLEQDVPTEADLGDARRRRDAGWRLVRRDWLDRAPADAELDAFVAEFAPGDSLADAYERSLARADERADRLRREAGRSATLADRLARRERLDRRRDELRSAREAAAAAMVETRRRWDDRLRGHGLPPLGPEELRSWLRLRAALVEAGERLRGRDRELEALARVIDEHREAIAAALVAAGRPEAAAGSLADRVDRAAAFLAEVEARRARRDEVGRAIDRVRRGRDEADRRLRETQRQLDDWRAAWSPLMARLGLEPAATPAQADSFLDRIARLLEHLDTAHGFRVRVEGIDRDARRFADDVAALAGEVAPDLADRPPEAAVAELHRRLGAARELRKERDAIAADRDRGAGKLRDARDAIAREGAALDALCLEARCESPDDLPAAEAAAADRARLEAELRRVEDRLRGSAAGAPLDAFVAEARAVDPDTLDLRINELDEAIAAIERERSELDQAIGGEREWLRSQKGGDEAADAAERGRSLLAELRGKVEDYAALRVAGELLQRGIEQFREQNQGPVVRRAGELFAALTAGSFQGLQLDEDDRGQPVLFGLRDDRTVGVEGMSDGSCDQLYLALRLASLEGWLARHEPIPLIADDILLNFDDERAAAALRALAELSRRTQVLFFTHHEHLVELARDALPVDVLFVHRLERAARTTPVTA